MHAYCGFQSWDSHESSWLLSCFSADLAAVRTRCPFLIANLHRQPISKMRSAVFFITALCCALLAAAFLPAVHSARPPVCSRASSAFPANSASSTYDYVIVGSGAGGGPLAARLAAHGYSVLLLEAGGDAEHSINTTVPLYHGASTEDEEIAWNYFVEHHTDSKQAKRDRYSKRKCGRLNQNSFARFCCSVLICSLQMSVSLILPANMFLQAML
jgi:hypothetical protein